MFSIHLPFTSSLGSLHLRRPHHTFRGCSILPADPIAQAAAQPTAQITSLTLPNWLLRQLVIRRIVSTAARPTRQPACCSTFTSANSLEESTTITPFSFLHQQLLPPGKFDGAPSSVQFQRCLIRRRNLPRAMAARKGRLKSLSKTSLSRGSFLSKIDL